jgi:hypothetical protein
MKGCPWRGPLCPIHDRKYPNGYHATADMMRHRHNDASQADPLDADAARELDWRIRLNIESGATNATFAALMADARRGRIHNKLGFPSWPAYVRNLARAVGAVELTW